MTAPTVVFRAEETDRLISTAMLGGWIVKTFEDPQGRQYQIMIPPQPVEEGKNDTN